MSEIQSLNLKLKVWRQSGPKAEGRFAKADKQRTGLSADPERQVAREKQRIARRKGKDKRKK